MGATRGWCPGLHAAVEVDHPERYLAASSASMTNCCALLGVRTRKVDLQPNHAPAAPQLHLGLGLLGIAHLLAVLTQIFTP